MLVFRTLATLKSVACVAAKRDVRRKLKPLALAPVCPRWLWSSGDSIAVKRGRRDVRKQCLCTLLESRSTAAPCCVAYGNARDGLPTTHGTFVNCTKRFLTRCCLQTIQGSSGKPSKEACLCRRCRSSAWAWARVAPVS